MSCRSGTPIWCWRSCGKLAVFVSLFNRRYEGKPTAGAVKIPVRDTEVAVGDYDKNNGGELGFGATTYKTLPINKDKYVNGLIDGYDAQAVPDNLVADRLDSAGYSMGVSLDAELVTLLVTSGTASTNTTALTKATIYDSIVDEVAALKKKGLRPEEMWLAVTNETLPCCLSLRSLFVRLIWATVWCRTGRWVGSTG